MGVTKACTILILLVFPQKQNNIFIIDKKLQNRVPWKKKIYIILPKGQRRILKSDTWDWSVSQKQI